MKRYFLRTWRLGFDYWSAGDLDLALGLWGDPEVTRFIGGPFTNRQIQDRLDREIASSREYKVQYWPIFLLEKDEHAGCAGLRPYRMEDLVYELGIHLRAAYWSRGLAEEAGRAVIKFAFEEIGAKALFAGHHPANSVSQRLLLKLGFQATHEEFYAPTGLNHPSYLLASPVHT
jgi:RimJ/RimL family protein N-acetyltransferase